MIVLIFFIKQAPWATLKYMKENAEERVGMTQGLAMSPKYFFFLLIINFTELQQPPILAMTVRLET